MNKIFRLFRTIQLISHFFISIFNLEYIIYDCIYSTTFQKKNIRNIFQFTGWFESSSEP